jgi:hypothetical protein
VNVRRQAIHTNANLLHGLHERNPSCGKENRKMTTSKKDAHKASKLLRTSKSATVRSVAGSDLVQAKSKPKKK